MTPSPIQAAAVRRWVGFRNVLVRQYAEIDRSIVYQALRHELDELKALAAAVAEMVLDDDSSASPIKSCSGSIHWKAPSAPASMDGRRR